VQPPRHRRADATAGAGDQRDRCFAGVSSVRGGPGLSGSPPGSPRWANATSSFLELEGMLTADEVADVLMFTITQPRGMRILTTSFRPMTEASWG